MTQKFKQICPLGKTEKACLGSLSLRLEKNSSLFFSFLHPLAKALFRVFKAFQFFVHRIPGNIPAIGLAMVFALSFFPAFSQDIHSEPIRAKQIKKSEKQEKKHQNTKSQNFPKETETVSGLQAFEIPVLKTGQKTSQASVSETNWSNWSFDLYGGMNIAFALGDVEIQPLWDTYVNFTTSYLMEQGTEWGLALGARAQRDNGRYGFGRLTGDCPPASADCPTLLYQNQARSGAGYTSGFFTYGQDYDRQIRYQIERAYLFLNTAYGEASFGRQSGAARILSLNAPYTFYLTRASNAPTDFTKLAGVKTLNDSSGFAPKLSYLSPRWFGLKFGTSYTPKVDVCGVDFCVRVNEGTNLLRPLSPKLENLFELAASFEHHLKNGLQIQVTASHSWGKDKTGIKEFSDFRSASAGVALSYKYFTFGASFLKSNNGWEDTLSPKDYNAYDFGLAYEHKDWKLSLELGAANDDLAKITAQTAQAGVKFNFLNRFSIGGGVQKQYRQSPQITKKGREHTNEETTTVFIEGSVDF